MKSETLLLNELSYSDKLSYIAQFDKVKKGKISAFFMALVFGCVGGHHFYMGNWRLALLYILLWSTGISAIVGWVEMFFMPTRVANYNTKESIRIIQNLKGITP